MSVSRSEQEAREKRRAPRARTLGHAQIRVDGRKVNCVVRDLSDTGARLGVSRHAELPSHFVLSFVQRKLHLQARLRWRRGDLVGVSFEAPAPVPEWLGRNPYFVDA
jgi:hypothetical protein